jgi:hypothetical protein
LAPDAVSRLSAAAARTWRSISDGVGHGAAPHGSHEARWRPAPGDCAATHWQLDSEQHTRSPCPLGPCGCDREAAQPTEREQGPSSSSRPHSGLSEGPLRCCHASKATGCEVTAASREPAAPLLAFDKKRQGSARQLTAACCGIHSYDHQAAPSSSSAVVGGMLPGPLARALAWARDDRAPRLWCSQPAIASSSCTSRAHRQAAPYLSPLGGAGGPPFWMTQGTSLSASSSSVCCAFMT